MRKLITAALKLGCIQWAYEALFEGAADSDPAELPGMEFTSWRERGRRGVTWRTRYTQPRSFLLRGRQLDPDPDAVPGRRRGRPRRSRAEGHLSC